GSRRRARRSDARVERLGRRALFHDPAEQRGQPAWGGEVGAPFEVVDRPPAVAVDPLAAGLVGDLWAQGEPLGAGDVVALVLPEGPAEEEGRSRPVSRILCR